MLRNIAGIVVSVVSFFIVANTHFALAATPLDARSAAILKSAVALLGPESRFAGKGLGKNRGRDTRWYRIGWPTAEFDSKSGLLVSFRRDRPTKVSSSQRIQGPEMALSIARGFLREQNVSLSDVWHIVTNRRLDHGGSDVDYELEWRKSICGVQLPAFLTMDIDEATGLVTDYNLVDDTVTVSLIPKIGSRTAIETVRRATGYQYGKFHKAFLRIWYDPVYPEGKQTLEWQVDFHYDTSDFTGEMNAHVDADTGKIIDLTKGEASFTKGARRERWKTKLEFPKVSVPVQVPTPTDLAALAPIFDSKTP